MISTVRKCTKDAVRLQTPGPQSEFVAWLDPGSVVLVVRDDVDGWFVVLTELGLCSASLTSLLVNCE